MSTKKIYVQIVDALSGISQNGMIEEPVKEGLEIQNALAHFGVNYGYVKWRKEIIDSDKRMLIGSVTDSNKVVSVIEIS